MKPLRHKGFKELQVVTAVEVEIEINGDQVLKMREKNSLNERSNGCEEPSKRFKLSFGK